MAFSGFTMYENHKMVEVRCDGNRWTARFVRFKDGNEEIISLTPVEAFSTIMVDFGGKNYADDFTCPSVIQAFGVKDGKMLVGLSDPTGIELVCLNADGTWEEFKY